MILVKEMNKWTFNIFTTQNIEENKEWRTGLWAHFSLPRPDKRTIRLKVVSNSTL